MPPRIVLFNHEPFALELLEQLLKSEGYEHVDGMTELLRPTEVRALNPDLIIIVDVGVDRAKPVLRFLQQLKCNANTEQIPIILWMGSAARGQAIKTALGANALYPLPEPFSVAEFLSTVREALESHGS
ncbi:MAG: hypothetical protein M3220_10335 [Chloroflexota bacterium]|nr:hypothetical protein [Chloroflexota bacterium]